MTSRAMARVLALVGVTAVLTTCKDSMSPPVPGWLPVTLTSPNADDGGIAFLVTGTSLDSVRTTYPYFGSRADGGTSVRVVVAGNLTPGPVAEIKVPDVKKAGNYSATVREVSVRVTHAQRAITGYSLTIAP